MLIFGHGLYMKGIICVRVCITISRPQPCKIKRGLGTILQCFGLDNPGQVDLYFKTGVDFTHMLQYSIP